MPIVFVLSILIAAFILRAAEMPVEEEGGNKFGWIYYWNSMWCTFITMTTVGYGDIYPVSTMGKILCLLMCFWGNFLISLLIVSMAGVVEFDGGEQQAFFKINTEEAIFERFNIASDLIK